MIMLIVLKIRTEELLKFNQYVSRNQDTWQLTNYHPKMLVSASAFLPLWYASANCNLDELSRYHWWIEFINDSCFVCSVQVKVFVGVPVTDQRNKGLK